MFSGSYVAIVTPFKDNKVDIDKLLTYIKDLSVKKKKSLNNEELISAYKRCFIIN